jgi:homoserine kinase
LLITVRLPASTSNLGPGFDVLGLALSAYLHLTAEIQEKVEISVGGFGAGEIPTDETNLVYQAACEFCKRIGKALSGLRLHIDNQIPTNGGLGASGAAIVAGLLIANELSNTRMPKEEILQLAVGIEGHPDNVSATLFGGLTVNCLDNGRWRCRSMPISPTLKIVAVMPEFRILTSDARRVLPPKITLSDAIHNIGHTAYLVSSLQAGDFEALRSAMSDRLHEPFRAQLIPGYDKVKRAGLEQDALSVNVSGSGSTVVAYTLNNEQEIGEAMVKAFAASGVRSDYRLLTVDNEGAIIRNVDSPAEN